EGFSIGWAKDGKEALALAQVEAWDLIVLDIMMPFLDGWRVLKQLREEQCSTPVLMLTAKGTESDISKSIELGATKFLKKPFNPTDLVDVLNGMISEARSKKITSVSETDAEMKTMREEFVASFSDRKAILRKCLDRLSDAMIDSDDEEAVALITLEIRIVAHNLAGIAENYGFSELGTQATVIDDE